MPFGINVDAIQQALQGDFDRLLTELQAIHGVLDQILAELRTQRGAT